MHIKSVLTLALSIVCLSTIAQKNPLLVHSNAPIHWDSVTAKQVRDAVSAMISLTEVRVNKIVNTTNNAKYLSKAIKAFDEIGYDLGDLSMKLSIVSSTFLDDSARDAANEGAGKLANYASDLYLNEGLYNALKAFAASPFRQTLSPAGKKFMKETLLAFEKNGMKLDAAGKKELQAINEKMINLGIQFDRNIAEAKDSVVYTEGQLMGVPELIKAPWRRSEGKYVVRVNTPNYSDLLSNADDEATRKTMFYHYNNKAYPQNIKVLDSLFYYRDQYAKKLGFKSYAAYAVVDKMAESPATVWKFENDLKDRLTPYVTQQMNDLRMLKKQLNPALSDTIHDWDLPYYRQKLLDTKYKVNPEEIREYFEMNNTLRGMFSVYEKLFNLRIQEVHDIPTWYSKVKTFDMYKDSVKVGSFYLDLYPRANKYTHFACFPISQYNNDGRRSVLPVAALICNFPEGTDKQPSLLHHSDVVTMFHEFGHLVHFLLGRSDIASQSSFAVKGDFAEAPSQFLENWVWEPEPLKMIAKHYKTGKPLPESLLQKMKETQKVGIALQYIRQVYLGMLDFTYEDHYDEVKKKGIVEISKELSTMRQTPFAEGTHFITGFTHLSGYAANYYGYLWSKVFAEDMFSVFRKNGVMDQKTGISYRQNILEKASTIEEMDMLRKFLGREPNNDAFLESLGIK